MSTNTPPTGIPPLEIDQKALEAVLGGKPLPPPDVRISRPAFEGENISTPPVVATVPRLRPEPVPSPENPLAKLGGTFAPVDIISPEAAAALPDARQLLAAIVTSIHTASMQFTRLQPTLSLHAAALKTIHGFDLTEATEFLARAEKLLLPPEVIPDTPKKPTKNSTNK